MKKKLLILFMASMLLTSLNAQVSSDPNSEFYTDVQIWETKGLISNLPDMRPYPFAIINKIIDTIIKTGSETDKQTALEWQDSLTKQNIHTYGTGIFATKNPTEKTNTDQVYNIHFGVTGDAELLEGLAIGYDIGTIVQNESFDSILPSSYSNPYDDSGDRAYIGSLESVINVNTAFSYATENVTLQGGITRSAFGPFYDTSIVIAPDTYHTGNLTATIYMGDFTYQQSVFSLTATDDIGSGSGSGKLMALHEISYAPFRWLKLGYFETVLWDSRFEFIYLLPVSYMVGQNIGGLKDNIEMGLTAQIKPFNGLLWNNQLFVDDVSFNDIAKLDFDTKIIAALESQLAWTPSVSFNNDTAACKLVTLDFFFVNAYMYSHKATDANDYNYINFTTHGEQLSTEIEPNSYRLKLKAEFEPAKDFTITPFISIKQHGNVNESISTEEAIAYLNAEDGEYSTDGSAFNTPYIYDDDDDDETYDYSRGYIDAYLDDWIFLDQDHIETTFQTGVDTSFEIPIKVLKHYTTTLSLNLSYTFEYIHNCMDEAGDMFPGSSDEDTTPATATHVAEAIDDWVDRLYDTFNNFFSLSITYRY